MNVGPLHSSFEIGKWPYTAVYIEGVIGACFYSWGVGGKTDCIYSSVIEWSELDK